MILAYSGEGMKYRTPLLSSFSDRLRVIGLIFVELSYSRRNAQTKMGWPFSILVSSPEIQAAPWESRRDAKLHNDASVATSIVSRDALAPGGRTWRGKEAA
jgi:hypothetical protein